MQPHQSELRVSRGARGGVTVTSPAAPGVRATGKTELQALHRFAGKLALHLLRGVPKDPA